MAIQAAQTGNTVAGVTPTPVLQVSKAYMLVAAVVPPPAINVAQVVKTVAAINTVPTFQASQVYMLVAASMPVPNSAKVGQTLLQVVASTANTAQVGQTLLQVVASVGLGTAQVGQTRLQVVAGSPVILSVAPQVFIIT